MGLNPSSSEIVFGMSQTVWNKEIMPIILTFLFPAISFGSNAMELLSFLAFRPTIGRFKW